MATDDRGPVAEADWAAVQRCLGGDREAFAELVDRHRDFIYNFVRRMGPDRDRASDLAQETFVRAYSRLASFRGESAFRIWLCRIAARITIDHLRSQRPPTLPLAEAAITGDSGDWADQLAMRRAVQEAIASLPPIYRAAIVLRHVHELSYREIAQALDLKLATVKTHIRRARLLLRRRLAFMFGSDAASPGGARESDRHDD